MSALDKQEGVTWRPIPWADGYFVSDCGQVGSMLPCRNYAPRPSSMRILKGSKDKDGYRRVILYRSGVKTHRRVCRLVAEVWIREPKRGEVVRHLDGSKSNDRASNLQWGTPKENSHDMIAHGTRLRGSDINTAKLSEHDARHILQSSERVTDLAARYGVTPSQISHIKHKRSWAYVSA